MTTQPPDPAHPDASEQNLGYEQARDELIAVVQKLETGGTGLEESLALWERGERLAGICQQWLDGARERLTAASQGSDGDQPDSDDPDSDDPDSDAPDSDDNDAR